MHDSDKLKFSYRSYIWKGGVNPPDKDTEPPFVNDNPHPPNLSNIDPDAGKDWCFAYGESEWMSGKSWQDAFDQATGSLATKKKSAVAPIGRITCE